MYSRFILFTLVLFLSSCDYYLVNKYDHQIGVIKKAIFSDDEGFETCFEEKIFPYFYGRNPAGFGPGKDALRHYFRTRYYNEGITNESGYITFRFIINCKGKHGRFEIRQVGLDFEPKKFNKRIVDRLFMLVKNLDGWEPLTFYGDSYDSFFHLTFKITNGDIEEILP